MALKAIGYDELPNATACLITTGITTLTTSVDTQLTLVDPHPASATQFDTGHFFDSAAPTLLTIPRDGIYLVCASLTFAANATAWRNCAVDKVSGSLVLTQSTLPAPSGVSSVVGTAALARLLAGDQVALHGEQASGGNLNVTAGFVGLLYIANFGT